MTGSVKPAPVPATVPAANMPELRTQKPQIDENAFATKPAQNQSQKMQQIREMGRAAEDAVGIDQAAKVRIPSATNPEGYRIPDRLTATTLEEVKNVSHLNYTPQMQDFVKYSQRNNLKMILYIRPENTIYGIGTQISPTIRVLENQGMIRILTIPF
jgi:hypothetical protein